MEAIFRQSAGYVYSYWNKVIDHLCAAILNYHKLLILLNFQFVIIAPFFQQLQTCFCRRRCEFIAVNWFHWKIVRNQTRLSILFFQFCLINCKCYVSDYYLRLHPFKFICPSLSAFFCFCLFLISLASCMTYLSQCLK